MENYKKQNTDYYLADSKIIKGLYVTVDSEKIIRNCDYFGIQLSSNLYNISKRGKISILTLIISDYHFLQFNIKWNLNIKELNKLDNDSIPKEIKPMIFEAYKLTKMKTNNEFVLEFPNECLT